MSILVLDDASERLVQFTEKFAMVDTLILTTTAEDCIDQLKLQRFHTVCLDHDLGGKVMVNSGPGTGYEVTEWIANNCGGPLARYQAPSLVVVHSFNPDGAKNMVTTLTKAHIKTVRAPGYWTQS